ncbi:hypothetical protein [Bifidobacterium saguinibicoloris]|uniref:hypothetical protein n=1 Tax=Bifidobacterium saguinibicoloris TaxID=2834433 RepID=UPI001C55CFAB|nr:hypothetical protein [Bifidobacterium saguinibicoloris]MBW3080635.1 hypothetical protein [Bifidobacterium saguinibicoloris]
MDTVIEVLFWLAIGCVLAVPFTMLCAAYGRKTMRREGDYMSAYGWTQTQSGYWPQLNHKFYEQAFGCSYEVSANARTLGWYVKGPWVLFEMMLPPDLDSMADDAVDWFGLWFLSLPVALPQELDAWCTIHVRKGMLTHPIIGGVGGDVMNMLYANPWRPNLLIVSGRPFLWVPGVFEDARGNLRVGELETMLFPLAQELCRRLPWDYAQWGPAQWETVRRDRARWYDRRWWTRRVWL